MNKNLNYQSIERFGVKLNVAFTVDGKFYPASRYEPAEYPEVVIHEITAEDSEINLYNLLTEDQIESIVEIVESYLEY